MAAGSIRLNNTVSNLVLDTNKILINGVYWADRNIDFPGTFCKNPEGAGMFYQWDRRLGWSNSNPLIASNGSTLWDSNGSSNTSWLRGNDPSPSGWRVPTDAELSTLVDTSKVSNIWTTVNGVIGRLFTDLTNGNSLFLPAAGLRMSINGNLGNVGVAGNYQSSVQHISTASYAYNLNFNSSSINMANGSKANGYSVRCVAA